MLKIDTHQHFWIFDAVRDSWITPEMNAIRKDFLPKQLLVELQQSGIDGSIAVQASQTEAENDFLLSLAAQNDCIKGVVGWVDLCADNLQERLAFYANEKKMKGFRHVLQGEANRSLMLDASFMKGISALAQYNFTYDILIYPDQLQYVPELVKKFPFQTFIIDHLAKPDIKSGAISQWKKDISAVAQYKNVWCKVSGIITEADWKHWTAKDLEPYLDVVCEAFGAHRLLFGSDYPVCLVAGSYAQWMGVMEDYLGSFSVTEQSLFWGGNAIEVYHL